MSVIMSVCERDKIDLFLNLKESKLIFVSNPQIFQVLMKAKV